MIWLCVLPLAAMASGVEYNNSDTPSAQFVDSKSSSINVTNHILYLMHTGETAKALEEYQEYRQTTGSNDFELIEQIGLILLDQGFRLRDPEITRMTLFGAGVSTNEKALYIIEEALISGQPEQQLIALHFLAKYHNDRADKVIHRAMGSNSLLIRLETAFQLAKSKDPKAIAQTEALMAKVPEELWPIFPQIYAVSGSPEAKKVLRKLLTNSNEEIRIATIMSLAEFGHDDFLPHIRRMSSHHEGRQQEACATALGMLRDESSAPRLLQMAKSPNVNVKLAALGALYQLGRQEVASEVANVAKTGNIFAIAMLSEMPGQEAVLNSLMHQENLQIKVNAAASLLELGDRRSLPIIVQLLLRDTRDIGLTKMSSQGGSMNALKVVPSSQQIFSDNPVGLELSLHLREALLSKVVELQEDDFILIADAIFEKQQNDLIPALTEILENHPTPAVINLLKKHQQKVGAPLVRNYCNLTLYRLKEEGPYAQNLQDWVTQQRNIDLIQFRPVVPLDQRDLADAAFDLTPQETSRLLVEAFESFVATQDDKGVDVLISLIQTGNPKNKYALIGLLMRAIQ